MAYINIAGNPYCNAARYCEYLSDKSVVLEAGQSASRTYRLCAHMLIAGVVGLICLYIKGEIVPTALFVIFLVSIFIATFFISVHADAAEAIAISFMDNEECEKRTHYGGQTIGARETIFDSMAVKHREVAEEVKQVLLSSKSQDKSTTYWLYWVSLYILFLKLLFRKHIISIYLLWSWLWDQFAFDT